MGATEMLRNIKPWLDTLLGIAAIGLSIYATLVARAARRRLTITEPEDGEVHEEYAAISGINARRRRRVLVLQRTNRWYLQKDAVTPGKHGNWLHLNCHFALIGGDRTIVAVEVRPKTVEKLRQAFGDWGFNGNKNQVKSWDELIGLLDRFGHYRLSDPRRIRRVS